MAKTARRNTILLIISGTAICIAMVWGGMKFPAFQNVEVSGGIPAILGGGQDTTAHPVHPFFELVKLIAAAALATIVTSLNRRYHGDKPLARSLEQAQILLCVAGCLMMIIIQGSVARALGIAGAASIIRFRTPVDDPKDTVILFMLLSLGLTCGLGNLPVAGLGTIFLCVFLYVLDKVVATLPRPIMLIITASGSEVPASHIHTVLSNHDIKAEAREVSPTAVKYFATVPPRVPLEEVSTELMGGGNAGLKSVIWESPKKGKRADD